MFNCVMENQNENSADRSRFPEHTPLAMCYVPMQEIGELYSENTAFEKGTIFPDLYFPFKGKGSGANG